jgi:hypothetical protein
MSRKIPASKPKDLKEALRLAAVSLLLAGGASASTTMPAAALHSIYDQEATDAAVATVHFVDEKFHFIAEEKVFRIAAGKGTGTGAGAAAGTGGGAATGTGAAPAVRARSYGYTRYGYGRRW